MSNQKYAVEFREEAVRQVLNRGYSLKEVSANLDVSSHSLYKWLRGTSKKRFRSEIERKVVRRDCETK